MRLCDITEQRWAVGDHSDKAMGWVRTQLNRGSMALIWMDIATLFARSGGEFTLDLDSETGGRNSIGSRLQDAKTFWREGGYMNPSEIAVHANGSVHWGDGRHRMAAAFQMGQTYGPVLVDNETITNMETNNIPYYKTNPDVNVGI